MNIILLKALNVQIEMTEQISELKMENKSLLACICIFHSAAIWSVIFQVLHFQLPHSDLMTNLINPSVDE